MKQTAIFILIFTVIFSCSNDDDGHSNNPGDQILGTWGPEKEETISGDEDAAVISTNELDECTKSNRMILGENGEAILENREIVDGECVDNGTYNLNYIYNHSTQTLSLSLNSTIPLQIYKVVQLSEDELIVSYELNEDVNEDGVDDLRQIYFTKHYENVTY